MNVLGVFKDAMRRWLGAEKGDDVRGDREMDILGVFKDAVRRIVRCTLKDALKAGF